jgi:hypothetical protein
VSNKPKRTVDYFPHLCIQKDSLRIVEGQWGPRGYTCWFKLLERLGATPDHRLSLDDDKKKILLIWSESGLKPEEGMEIFELLAELGSIDKELFSQNIIWSENFISGISVVYKNRKRDLPEKPNSGNINLFSAGDNGKTTGQKPGSREEYRREEKQKNKEGDFLLEFPLEWKENESFKKAWSLWAQHRKELRKKLTPTSVKMTVNKLTRHPIETAIKMIENAIDKGWQGIYELNGEAQAVESGEVEGAWGDTAK